MSESNSSKSNDTPDIVIYTSAFCGYCAGAKSLLNKKGVEFTEIRIDKDTDKRAEMESRANGRTSVPQIFISDFHVGGCDEMYTLEEKGELDGLLGLQDASTADSKQQDSAA